MRPPSDSRISGLQHPLADLITTHLFVLSPNNSGSTFVKNALALSTSTWNLAQEGHRTFGFQGPNLDAPQLRLTWAADDGRVDRYRRSPDFDWSTTRQAWYAQATALDATASVFVEKSPPFTLVANQLVESFDEARFLVMVRNPFAMYEGILRRIRGWDLGGADPSKLAARHVATCLQVQRTNIAVLGESALLCRYEDLCADPKRTAARLADLIPRLHDINFDQRIPVKGMYDERLRDMNDDQVARLSVRELDIANQVFGPGAADLAFFGYELTG